MMQQGGKLKISHQKMELQRLQSVTNLKKDDSLLYENKNYPTLSSQASKININQSRIVKQLRIGIQTEQSGLPQYSTKGNKTQIARIIPSILFSVLRQFHVIYLIFIGVFMALKFFCFAGFQWQIFTIQLLLTLLYVFIELFSRIYTFQSYTSFSGIKTSQYQIWNKQTKKWVKIEEQDLKVGQIIKIMKNNQISSISQERDGSSIQKKIRTPINILPIFSSLSADSVDIDTFLMNKNEERMHIEIDQRFAEFITMNDERYQVSFSQRHLNQSIQIDEAISNCKINYLFFNSNSQSFEAILQFEHLDEQKKFSHNNIVPSGAYFYNQDYLIGVVLFNLDKKTASHLRYLLHTKNTILSHLQSHLITIIFLNLMGAVILMLLNILLSTIMYNQLAYGYFHCYFFNYIATFSFSVNVVMYILLAIHHIYDLKRISKKSSIRINNYMKSIDQFGMVQAFIMDEFTFVQKNILAVTEMDINKQKGLEFFSEEIILYLINNSMKFKLRFPHQWLSLAMHYNQRYKKQESNSFEEKFIHIQDEMIDISGAVRMIARIDVLGNRRASVRNYRSFFIRFNEKIIFSILESISLEKRQYFSEKIQIGKSNGQLMTMVQLLQVDRGQQMDLSVNIYELQYKFYCLIRMKFLPHKAGVDFVRQLQNKYSIILMTQSPYEYFDRVLVTAELKSQNCITLIFQETQQSIFRKQLQRRIIELRDGLLDLSTIKKSHRKKNLIVALDSSLIAYLARVNIHKMLGYLSKKATYLIFYNMSQFQKQLCAANVFKIFHNHIFISNFAIDSSLFKISNLSASIEGYSANKFSTIVVKNYPQLHHFITNQSVNSIELTSIIIKNHIFKNQCLIASLTLAMLIVHRGQVFQFNLQYSTYLFFIFNIGFTMFPIFYYLFARPRVNKRAIIDNKHLNYHLKQQHFKAIFLGFTITFVSYSLVPQRMVYQLFVVILLNCTIMGNLYYLVIDNSVQKKCQVLIIILQIIFSTGIIFIAQYVPTIPHNLFTFGIVMSPLFSEVIYYYVSLFVTNIFIILLIFYFIAFHDSLTEKQIGENGSRGEDLIEQIAQQSNLDKNAIVAKISRSSGKQMRFRGYQSQAQFF